MRTAGGASMTRHILRTGLALMAAAALAGCLGDSDSDEYGEDITRYESNPEAGDPDTYRVRAINGKLDKAFVWLDMDGDQALSTYDYQDYLDDFLGEDEEGSRLGIDGDNFELDEPWAVTNAEGHAELDVSSLDLPAADAPDIDPEQFSLMVVAIPDVTLSNGDLIQEAFFLSAPPGVDTISPFTTLAQTLRWLRGEDLSSSRAATQLLQDGVFGSEEKVSPYQDYLNLRGASRLPYYATTIRRLLQAQVAPETSTAIGEALGDPQNGPKEVDYIFNTEEESHSFFPGEEREVVGSVVLDQAAQVIKQVDDDIGSRGLEGYELPGNDALGIRNLTSKLTNPYVAVQQRYYTPAPDSDADATFAPGNIRDGGGTSDAPDRYGRLTAENAQLNAQVFLDYALDGRLRRLDVLGETEPSMTAFQFLAGSSSESRGDPVSLGFMPPFDVDLGRSVTEPVERDSSFPEVPDERFSGEGDAWIDWDAPKIGLDSSRISDSGSTGEVDGVLERAYLPPESGEYALVRRIPGNPGTEDARLSLSGEANAVNAAFPVNQFLLHERFGEGVVNVEYDKVSEGSGCGASVQHVNAEQIVNLSQEGGPSIDITRFGHKREDKPGLRVLVETYQDPEDDKWVRREYEYFSDGVDVSQDGSNGGETDYYLDSRQKDLIRSVRVRKPAGSKLDIENFCSGEPQPFAVSGGSNLKLYIGYEYMRFADYLESIGTRSQ